MVEELRGPFEHGDFAEMIRVMDRHFGQEHYTVKNLFHDEQRKILERIVAHPREEIYGTLRHITEYYAPLLRFVAELPTPPLRALGMATEIVLNNEIRHQLDGETIDLERMRGLLQEAAATKVTLYNDDLAYALKLHLERVSDRFAADYRNAESLQHFADAAEFARIAPFKANLWKPQNTCYGLIEAALPAMRRCAGEGNEQARAWVEKFMQLGEKLGFAMATTQSK
jgi:hypothetical protein